jgi:hypothetical protein
LEPRKYSRSGIHRQVFHPSDEKLNPPSGAGDRKKGCPREYAHIHMGVHEGNSNFTKNLNKGENHQSNGMLFI